MNTIILVLIVIIAIFAIIILSSIIFSKLDKSVVPIHKKNNMKEPKEKAAAYKYTRTSEADDDTDG